LRVRLERMERMFFITPLTMRHGVGHTVSYA